MRSLATARERPERELAVAQVRGSGLRRDAVDVWREGCWRFVVYPGYARGRPVDIVFAVYLQSRRPAVRAAVLDADTDEVLGPTGTRESAVL